MLLGDLNDEEFLQDLACSLVLGLADPFIISVTASDSRISSDSVPDLA